MLGVVVADAERLDDVPTHLPALSKTFALDPNGLQDDRLGEYWRSREADGQYRQPTAALNQSR